MVREDRKEARERCERKKNKTKGARRREGRGDEKGEIRMESGSEERRRKEIKVRGEKREEKRKILQIDEGYSPSS